MKRWAILTVFLYAAALLLLTIPVTMLAFGNWGIQESQADLKDVLELFDHWFYWLWLGVLVAGQFLLLLLPISLARKRLPARRPLRIPVIVTAFFLANLVFAGIFSIFCVIFNDQAYEYFTLSWFSNLDLSRIDPSTHADSGWSTLLTMILTVLVFWVIWALVFFRATKSDEPDAQVKRATRWLLRGSILELLIAVPSHVLVRRQDNCCAPLGTFWGIATGISVMLLCFGPGVFFLFVERYQRLQPKESRPPENQ